MNRYELDGLTITVEDAGEGVQPWSDGLRCFVYKVTVDDECGPEYETLAYGSQHDYERGIREPRSIGGMVADELLSAAFDPDEFWTLAIGDERPNRERYEQVTKVIDTAAAMEPSLERNQEAIVAMANGEEVAQDA